MSAMIVDDSPVRLDLPLRSNSDGTVSLEWTEDGRPVAVTSAVLTFEFDEAPQEWVDGVPSPRPDPERHVVDSTTAGDPDGWVDQPSLRYGGVNVYLPYGIWAGYQGRTGRWDSVAVSGGMTRCLARGLFVVEDGVSSLTGPVTVPAAPQP